MFDRLSADQTLTLDDGSFTSPNGSYTLVFQHDGNLVLYKRRSGPWRALWASNTDGQGVEKALMQGDGNFVLSDQNRTHAFWTTKTDGHPGAYMQIQDDANVVIYDSAGKALWATNTVIAVPAGPGAPVTAVRQDVIDHSSPQRMHTWASLERSGPSAGRLVASTRTWTSIMFKGFTGGVYIKLLNANSDVIGLTDVKWPLGVDGTFIGRSNRVDNWQANFDPAIAAQTQELVIVHEHMGKNRILDIAKELIKYGAQIAAVA
ncbi:MAG: hypothetical protein M3R24_25955 [Chloroflexota bacterium]|nr:hypothetical protein [Chloroflexota bacterium]